MKNKLSVILLSAILLASSTAVYAEVTSTLGTANNIIISGKADSSKLISVVLLNNTIVDEADRSNPETVVNKYKSIVEGGEKASLTHIKYYTQIITENDGSYTVDIPMGDVEKGEYTAYINNGDSVYIPYTSNSYRIELIEAIKNGEKSTAEVIGENIPYISTESDLYNALSEKSRIADYCDAGIKNIDTSDAEKAIEELMQIVDEAIIAQAMHEGRIADFDAAFLQISDMNDVAGLIDTVTDEGKSAILSNMQEEAYGSMAEFRSRLKVQIALATISYNTNATAENVLSALKSNNSFIGLDLSGLLKLSESNQALAAKQLAQAKPKTESAAQSTINNSVSQISNKYQSSSSGGSGGGGGGGGTGSGSSGTMSGTMLSIGTAIESANEGRAVFSDLSGFEWAKDAIEKLTEYKIISGYDDATFRPGNNVTRAEFVKMIVNAFYASDLSNNGSVFYDVADDDWHRVYIMTAYENKIVSGVGNDMFAPSANITRQDMSVMLYNAARAFNLIEEAQKEEFADDGEIADYAQEAVYTLRGMDIIDGRDNNVFAPKAFATRAEAAKLIYSLVITVEE